MLIPCSPSDRLQETAFVAKETLAVRIKNRHQTHFGDVKTLTKQIDADDDIDVAVSKSVDDLRALNGVDLGVKVVGFDPHPIEVSGDLLSELDGHDRDQTTLLALNACIDFGEQVVDLAGRWPNLDFGVQQTRGPQFHFGDSLDALQHVVHRFGLWMLFGKVGRTCTASRRCMEEAVGDRLPRHLAQVPQFPFAGRG